MCISDFEITFRSRDWYKMISSWYINSITYSSLFTKYGRQLNRKKNRKSIQQQKIRREGTYISHATAVTDVKQQSFNNHTDSNILNSSHDRQLTRCTFNSLAMNVTGHLHP